MANWWLVVLSAWPLGWAVATTLCRHRPIGDAVDRIGLATAAIPAVLVAVLGVAGPPAEFPWLLLGMRLVLDDTGQIFLLLTSLLWTFAGISAVGYLASDPRRGRFTFFWLLTAAGNFGLIVAGDIATFYFSFSLMSFAAYGLIVHTGSLFAQGAGRVYIALVIAGEVLLFVGLIWLANVHGSMSLDGLSRSTARSGAPGWILALIWIGFGIKAGAVPLHMWLPLAHPAAPVPASAVLSGAMIKAGLLGWLRFLPIGEVPMEMLGTVCLTSGIVAAFFGVIVGTLQRDPKVILAYSSISQMGMINVGVGTAMINPEIAPAAVGAVAIYVLHHGLAKGALFLSVAAYPNRITVRPWLQGLIVLGAILPAAALAGLPFTSGGIAKTGLKSAVPGELWGGWITLLLSLAAVGTTLIMVRFLWVLHRSTPSEESVDKAGPASAGSANASSAASLRVRLTTGGWALAVGSVLLAVYLIPWTPFPETRGRAMAFQYIWPLLWPIGAGLALALFLWSVSRWPMLSARANKLQVPPGDLLVVADVIASRSAAARGVLAMQVERSWPGVWQLPSRVGSVRRLARWVWSNERALTHWPTATTLWVIITLALVAAMLWPR